MWKVITIFIFLINRSQGESVDGLFIFSEDLFFARESKYSHLFTLSQIISLILYFAFLKKAYYLKVSCLNTSQGWITISFLDTFVFLLKQSGIIKIELVLNAILKSHCLNYHFPAFYLCHKWVSMFLFCRKNSRGNLKQRRNYILKMEIEVYLWITSK